MPSPKFPILLSSVSLFNASFISPAAPPDKSERVYGTALYEHICPTVWPPLHKLSASIPCVAELIVLLATRYPSPLSSRLLSRLVLSGNLPTPHANACFAFGAALAMIGSLGRFWCFRALGHHFTHHLTLRHDHRLVTTGPYALVRHPGYLFGHLAGLGMSLMIASPGSFVRRCGWLGTLPGKLVLGVWAAQNIAGWVLAWSRCKHEDAYLRAHFGAQWDAYAERVRYRMIPGVY